MAEVNQKLNITVSWENLMFKVPDPNNKKAIKTILNGLSGHVKPGELVAVIGPSGSGKSSFLNCIGGRTVEGVTGKIRFNGARRPTNFARFTGYVVQDDLYFQSLTVRETLTFAANLKLPMSLTKEEKSKRVENIINELDLIRCQDTQIGIIGKGISGGERRRLAIGLEILNEPSLLLLDEPTSGLDSASALMVGKILVRLCKNKEITILCTIHQPRYSLATMFDKIYFLAKGNEIYFGPSIPHCLPFFESAGYKCPEYDNPADFLLDLVNTSMDDEEGKKNSKDGKKGIASQLAVNIGGKKHGQERTVSISAGDARVSPNSTSNASMKRDEIIEHLISLYRESEYRQNALNFEVSAHDDGNKVFGTISNDFFITPWYNQLRVIFTRSLIFKVREPIALMTQAFNALVIPVLFGSVYYQIDLSEEASFDRLSAISLLVLMLSFFAFDIIMLFPLERDIFNRENASGMYRASMFYFGRTFAEMPQHIILLGVMATIAYWMYGLQEDAQKFVNWFIILELAGLAGAGLLMIFGAFAKTLEQSNLLATFFILLFMLFDGNWISLDKVPVYWKWVRYISFIGIGSQGATVNEYSGLVFDCTDEQLASGRCGFQTGEDFLEARGLKDVTVSGTIWQLIVLGIAYRIVAFIGVLFFFRLKSPSIIFKEIFGINTSNEVEYDEDRKTDADLKIDLET